MVFTSILTPCQGICQVFKHNQRPSQASQRFFLNIPTEPLWRPKQGCGNFSLPTAETELLLSRHFASRVACLKNEQQEHFGALFFSLLPHLTPTHPTQRNSNVAPILNASCIDVNYYPTLRYLFVAPIYIFTWYFYTRKNKTHHLFTPSFTDVQVGSLRLAVQIRLEKSNGKLWEYTGRIWDNSWITVCFFWTEKTVFLLSLSQWTENTVI